MTAGREVLVVDDDRDLREALREILEDAGYRVLTAANGLEAIDVLLGGARPDAILLDLMMPESDGPDFRLKQRAAPEIAHIPIIAMTASGRAESELAFMHSAGFLRKPFEYQTLIDLVARVVTLPRAPAH